MLPDWRAVRTPENDYSQYGLYHRELWTAYPHVQPKLLSRAWSVRKRYFQEPVTKLRGVKYSYILSSNLNTRDRVTRQADGTLALKDPDRAGDSLVPQKVTYQRMSSVERARTHIIGPNERTAEHAMLLNDETVLGLVEQEFSQ
jgi:hypothetical protein